MKGNVVHLPSARTRQEIEHACALEIAPPKRSRGAAVRLVLLELALLIAASLVLGLIGALLLAAYRGSIR